jgi:large subunit ribosomal protein L35Ae
MCFSLCVMKALIVSYKRGRHLIHPRQVILKVPGIGDKGKAQALVGKKVVFTTKGKKVIKGVITRPHGGKGLVRARFTKGLPGQAIGKEVILS